MNVVARAVDIKVYELRKLKVTARMGLPIAAGSGAERPADTKVGVQHKSLQLGSPIHASQFHSLIYNQEFELSQANSSSFNPEPGFNWRDYPLVDS